VADLKLPGHPFRAGVHPRQDNSGLFRPEEDLAPWDRRSVPGREDVKKPAHSERLGV
jgi:hypothetical protein